MRNAERLRARLEREYAEGIFDPWEARKAATPASRTFVAAAQAFLDERSTHLRKDSVRAYRTALNGLDRLLPPGVRVDAVTAEDVRPYLSASHVSDETLRHRLRHLRTFFGWCVEERLCKANPIAGFKLRKAGKRIPAYFSPEQVERLLSTLNAPATAWLRDVVLVALCTGLRRGELCAMRWGGVDLAPGEETFTIYSGEHGFHRKNDNDLTRPLVGDALAVVKRRSLKGAAPDEAVLTTAQGTPIAPDHLTHAFKRAVRAAGLPERLHLHSLRHTCATWLVRAGTPLPIVSRMLDHSSVAVTQRYTHASTDDLRAYGRATFEGRGGEAA